MPSTGAWWLLRTRNMSGECHPSFDYLGCDVQPQPPPTCAEAKRREEHRLKPRYSSIMRFWVLFQGCVLAAQGVEVLLHYCQVSVDIEVLHSDSINPWGVRFSLLPWGGRWCPSFPSALQWHFGGRGQYECLINSPMWPLLTLWVREESGLIATGWWWISTLKPPQWGEGEPPLYCGVETFSDITTSCFPNTSHQKGVMVPHDSL